MRARAAVLLYALLALPGLAQACEACKQALGEDPAARGFSRGIYLSIVVMLGVVFGLIGILIFKIVQLARQDPSATTAARGPKG